MIFPPGDGQDNERNPVYNVSREEDHEEEKDVHTRVQDRGAAAVADQRQDSGGD